MMPKMYPTCYVHISDDVKNGVHIWWGEVEVLESTGTRIAHTTDCFNFEEQAIEAAHAWAESRGLNVGEEGYGQ